MREQFIEKSFHRASMAKIATANAIIAAYADMDLRLTLRQLYYQFVAHHDLPNTEKSYKNLGRLLSDARLAGLVDWDAIEDRGRVPSIWSQWASIQDRVDQAVDNFRLPRWAGQENYAELWVEKQALAGVLEGVAYAHHATLMVNKGYSSQSAMYEAAKRFIRKGRRHDNLHLFYLGDMDPSGEDMVRDVRERLDMFGVRNLTVTKIALTMDQVEEYGPPPNPAKLSDSRAREYIAKWGRSSWEVDALDPATLVELITEAFDGVLDRKRMDRVIRREDKQREKLQALLDSADWE